MTSLLFSLILACSPSKVDISADEGIVIGEHDTGTTTPSQEPVGVIPADDCRQLNIGDLACNFALTDQNADVWELYQHHGDVIVLDFSTVWCYPCQMAGHYAQPLQDDYANEGVIIVTVLIDGANTGAAPTSSEIDQWVSSHNVTTAPILQGSRDKMIATDAEALDGYLLGGFPTYVYVGRDMKFYGAHVGFSEEAARHYIELGL